MNTTIRNRLVGGAVLAVCAALFLPELLTPKKVAINQPSFSFSSHVDQKNLDDAYVTKDAQKDTKPSIELSSVGQSVEDTQSIAKPVKEKVVVIKDTKKSLNIPIVLESVDDRKPQKRGVNQQSKKWIQVASFSNLKSADHLAKELSVKRYPVKTELVEINKKTYKRVMIGPIASSQVDSMIKKISELGYHPTIQ